MRVVVTGSSGRVGRAIFVHLSKRHDAIGIDRSPSSSVHFVGDLLAPGLLDRAIAGADAVIHTAALHAPHVGVVADAEFDRINVDATRALLDAASRHRVPRIVFTSTTALYGDAAIAPDRATWIDETVEPRPRTIYHHTKLEAERLLRQAAAQGGPSVRILRMSRCFPEPANVMAAFRLHRGIDARDVASAHAAALVHAGADGDTFVISGATPFQPDDLEALRHDAVDVLRQRSPDLAAAFFTLDWPLPTRIDRVCCPRKAMDELDWLPRYGFDEVIAQWQVESSEVLQPDLATSAPAE